MPGGPHRSLLLSRSWKYAAERVANPNYALEEVAAAQVGALLRDAKTLLVQKVTMLPDEEDLPSIFPEDRRALTGELRSPCAGTTNCATFDPMLVASIQDGLNGASAARSASIVALPELSIWPGTTLRKGAICESEEGGPLSCIRSTARPLFEDGQLGN